MAINVVSTRSPSQVTQVMIEQAIAKHHVPLPQMFWKAFMAGIYLSIGGFLNATLQGDSPGIMAENPGLLKVLGAFIFPVGLVMIVLNGAELLTSNMMSMPMAAIKRGIPFWSIPLNWTVVFFGNLVGSLFFDALLVKYTGLFNTEAYRTYMHSAATAKAVTPEWHQVFLRGIGCNVLVCLAIWQAAGSRETISKIFAAWFPIWTFVAVGYDHVVANMFIVPTGIMLGADISVALYIRKSVIASFIGNVVGAQFIGLPMLWHFWSQLRVNAYRGQARESDVEAGIVSPSGGRDTETMVEDPMTNAESSRSGSGSIAVKEKA